MSSTLKAYCWRSGLIGFARSVPEGAEVIAEGPAKILRAVNKAFDQENMGATL